MIEALQVLGGRGDDVLSLQLVNPGWYLDPLSGYYYLDVEGQRWPGNPVTSQFLVPMAFFAEYEYPATSIGGPLYVTKKCSIKVNWSFSWQGVAKTIVLRMGGCVKVMANYDEVGASVVRQSVSVNASTSPVKYSGSTVFPYDYSVTPPKHLFILPEGIQYDVVYTNAFIEVTAEFKDLKIGSYSKA